MKEDERKIGFAPVCFVDSKVLILGSFPSVKSRQVDFYYGNKQNRFWRTICGFFGEGVPETKDEKIDFLYRRKIALWDMAVACEIQGSADSSVKNAVLADLNEIFSVAKLEKILLNGTLAYQLFCKGYAEIDIPYQKLPSTSPANPKFDERIWRESLNDVFQLY